MESFDTYVNMVFSVPGIPQANKPLWIALGNSWLNFLQSLYYKFDMTVAQVLRVQVLLLLLLLFLLLL